MQEEAAQANVKKLSEDRKMIPTISFLDLVRSGPGPEDQ